MDTRRDGLEKVAPALNMAIFWVSNFSGAIISYLTSEPRSPEIVV